MQKLYVKNESATFWLFLEHKCDALPPFKSSISLEGKKERKGMIPYLKIPLKESISMHIFPSLFGGRGGKRRLGQQDVREGSTWDRC